MKKRYKHKKGYLSHLCFVIKPSYSDGNSWYVTEYLLRRMAAVLDGRWTGSSLDPKYRDISFLFKDRKKMFKLAQDKLVKSRIRIDKTEIFDVSPTW